MKRPGGFSLAELVVVLVIAGIIAAIAIPKLADTETKATWFHEEAKAAIRHAQRQAVAQKRCVFVDVTSSQLALYYGDSGCALPAPASRVPLKFLTQASGKNPGDAYVVDAPSGTTLSTATFRFDALGRPAGAVSLSIGAKSINVMAETGYVREQPFP